MKNAVLFLLVVAMQCANGQGFINLNFESARLPTLAPGESGGLVAASDGIPGWTVSYASGQGPQVFYNALPLGGAGVSIIGPNFTQFDPAPAMEGEFCAALFSGVGPNGQLTWTSIEQSGTIPDGTESLTIYGLPGLTPSLSLNGTSVPMFPIGSSGNCTIYGGDISSYSGQAATIAFTAAPAVSNPGNGFWLDNIQFSTVPVPEPGTFGLLAVGSALFGCRVWRKNRAADSKRLKGK